MELQRRELRTASASPVLGFLQHPSTNALVLEITFDSDLGNMTVQDFAVHQVGRLFQPEADEPVVFTTKSSLLPPARRTVSRFWNACRACTSKVGPAASPVEGSMPGWPDTNSKPAAPTA
jgi:hypothetical protein